jgi:hypothetical protein
LSVSMGEVRSGPASFLNSGLVPAGDSTLFSRGCCGQVVREAASIRMEQDGITCKKLFLARGYEDIGRRVTSSWEN